MNYYAAKITDYTFQQLKKLSSDWEKDSFQNLCYDYPLIFVKKSHGIIFFNMDINLDQVQYDFLYELVKNATKKQKEKGLSPIKLFEALGCKHTREKSNNKNYNSENSEYNRANERMRDIKRCIKQKIYKYYNSLNESENFNQIGIYEVHQGYKTTKYFNGDFEISEDSPYYNFEIESAINLLIVNQKEKERKYTTEFIFKK